jgi:hypothetical protein
MVSLKVGFLCMANSQLLGVLWMVVSRKFSLWSFSFSAVKIRFGCILLKSCRMLCISEWFESYMINYYPPPSLKQITHTIRANATTPTTPA